jgi:hypothetical protein
VGAFGSVAGQEQHAGEPARAVGNKLDLQLVEAAGGIMAARAPHWNGTEPEAESVMLSGADPRLVIRSDRLRRSPTAVTSKLRVVWSNRRVGVGDSPQRRMK